MNNPKIKDRIKIRVQTWNSVFESEVIENKLCFSFQIYISVGWSNWGTIFLIRKRKYYGIIFFLKAIRFKKLTFPSSPKELVEILTQKKLEVGVDFILSV
jgi:hypothetical protein